jgi:2-polyprenyl-3-methyl-5-hydroxy-6-metoxy-1,4-benzoquinol methylase
VPLLLAVREALRWSSKKNVTRCGKEFAAVNDKKWAYWGPKMWAFLSGIIAREMPHAHTSLDLCCGSGSLLRLVCGNGFAATGVDVSKYQVAHARRNAPSARLVVNDIRKLSLGRNFDVVTCMFDITTVPMF